MASGVRWLAVCLGCCAAGLMGLPVVAFGETTSSGGGSSSMGSSLVTPGSPTEAEQLQAQEEAKLSSPEAVAAREESRTKYENLNTEQAGKADGEAFPAVISEPAGGPPKLPAGESIVGYPLNNAAQVDLPESKHGVIESLAPIAVETGPGLRVPVDLSLGEVGGAFEPKTPVVGVRIPKRLGDGVSLGSTGVSLTPVGEQGSVLGGSEGVLDGATVFYANTQTDTDTVVKPTTVGFETDTVLRSVESPQQLSFKVGMPEGARLVASTDGSGSVEVIKEGVAVATIPAPRARDAMGVAVPVSMSVSEDLLKLAVNDRSGEYQYPIVVDPDIAKDEQVTGSGKPTNWKFCVNYSTKCEHEEGNFKSAHTLTPRTSP